MQTRKKKTAIFIIFVIILCILMTFLWQVIINTDNSNSNQTEFITVTEPRVYITTYGKRYHSAECSYLTQSQHAIGKQEAISKGYTACSRCGGISSGTVTVTYMEKVAEKEKPKDIRVSIFLSVLLAPNLLIYLLIYLLLTEFLKTQRSDYPLSERSLSSNSPRPRRRNRISV